MAPFGPAPAMVGNETSLSRPVSRRKLSSASTASISVRLPPGASRSNQARKRVTAAPSRSCAARAPAISAAFFTAFIGAIGSPPRMILPPFSATRRAIASGQAAGSSRTVRCSLPSAARSRSKSRASRARRRALRGDGGRRCRACGRRHRAPAGPPAARSRSASTTGVCGTSLPRMLNSQATACGSETTSASAAAFASRRGCARACAAASSPA